MSELQRTPVYRVLSRPSLLLGGERRLVIFTGTLCVLLMFSCFSVYTVILGLTLWVASIAVFRQMAKADPHLSEIYVRHIRYQRYYPARSTHWCPYSYKQQ